MTITPSDTEVYQDHATELIRYATVLVGPDSATDVMTDAVLATFATPKWREVGNPRAYLYRAVYNTAQSWHRSNGRRRRREEVVALRSATVWRDPDVGVDVHRALETLSAQQRAVIFLTYWDDQQPAQIAELLDISEGAVRKQLARAREQLRKVIPNA
jgi:RNA polymerase sigma factor (sigma-70 family)